VIGIEPFVIRGSYFGRRPFEGRFERDGLRMTLRGWVYALEDYARGAGSVCRSSCSSEP